MILERFCPFCFYSFIVYTLPFSYYPLNNTTTGLKSQTMHMDKGHNEPLKLLSLPWLVLKAYFDLVYKIDTMYLSLSLYFPE